MTRTVSEIKTELLTIIEQRNKIGKEIKELQKERKRLNNAISIRNHMIKYKES